MPSGHEIGDWRLNESRNTQPRPEQSRRNASRIILKAAILFVVLNLLFAVLRPLPFLGSISLYNTLFPGRERLPYGENPAESYNLSLNNLPAMFASHTISQPKAADEFRVVLIGDSGTWGWFLENEETLAGQLNGMGLEMENGRNIKVYNLGYPIMSLSKDVLLLNEAMAHDPDLILWPVTLESFVPHKQLTHPLLQNNPAQMRQLIADNNLNLDPHDPQFVEPDFWQSTIIGQRRSLADLLRLQQLGISWGATSIDQAIPAEIPLRKSDFDTNISWQGFDEPTELSTDDLAFDALSAGMTIAGDVPILLINEPIFVSDGENSDLHYDAWYPRWAYDQYRDLLTRQAAVNNWQFLDLWNAIPPEEFTDSPVHLTPDGTLIFANRLAQELNR